jgi:RAD51-like protein 2
MRDIPLAHLPLRPSTLQTLQKRGFYGTRELTESKQSGMANLAAELALNLSQTSALYAEVDSCLRTTTPVTKTAAALLEENVEGQGCIITFCRHVDTLLGGGIAMGELTEIAGPPGVGKTQWGMQLAVDARLPNTFGGVAGETVYVDTEGSFSPERCHDMATSLVQHIEAGRRRRQEKGQKLQPMPAWFAPDTILQGIHVYRVHDEAAQTSVLYSLPKFLQDRQEAGTPVRLVVVDSMAFHHRAAPPNSDFVGRTRSLTSQAAFLTNLAAQSGIAVVAINQMTTKMTTSEASNQVPALGESWAHAVTTRILLSRPISDTNGVRTCTLVKSPRLASGSADYQILQCGIRGVDAVHVSDGPKRQRTV